MKRLVVGSLALLYSVNAAFGMDEDASGAVEQAPGGEMPGVDPGAGSAAGALGGAGGVGLAGAAGRAAGRAAGALGEAGTAGATPDSLPMASTSIPEEDSETEAEETDEEGKPGKEYEASNSMDPTLSQIKGAESTSRTVPSCPHAPCPVVRDLWGFKAGSALGMGYNMITDQLLGRIAVPISQNSWNVKNGGAAAGGAAAGGAAAGGAAAGGAANEADTAGSAEGMDGAANKAVQDVRRRRRLLSNEDSEDVAVASPAALMWQDTPAGKLMRPQESVLAITIPRESNVWRDPTQEIESMLSRFGGKPSFYGAKGLLTDTTHFGEMLTAYASNNVVIEDFEAWEVSSENILDVDVHPYFERDICGDMWPKCDDFTAKGGCTQKDLRKIYSIVQRYGTHYVQKVQMGGLYSQRFTVNTKNQMFMKGLEKHGGRLEEFLGTVVAGFRATKSIGDGIVSMKTKGGSTIPSAGAGFAHSSGDPSAGKDSAEVYAESRAKLMEYMKNKGIILVTEQFIGGMQMPGSALEPKDKTEWLNTVPKSPSPIRYSIQPIDRLLAKLPCDGKKKAKMWKKAVKIIIASFGRKKESLYTESEIQSEMDSKWETVEKAKSDWMKMMRGWLEDRRESINKANDGWGQLKSAGNKANGALQTDATSAPDAKSDGISQDMSTLRPQEAPDEESFPVTPADQIWTKMAHEADGENSDEQMTKFFNAPMFIFRQLSAAAYDCSRSCSNKRRVNQEVYALITESSEASGTGSEGGSSSGSGGGGGGGGGGGTGSEFAGGAPPGAASFAEVSATAAGPEGAGKGADKGADNGADKGAPSYDLFRLTGKREAIVTQKEAECDKQCGDHFEKAIRTVDSTEGAIDTELNRVFENFYKLSCSTCSRAVAQSAQSIASGLFGGVISDAPLKLGELSPYCGAPGLGAVEQHMCKATVSAIAQRTTEVTRTFSSLADYKMPLSPRLMGLANCQSNCDPRSYSFANLGGGASPPVWSAQVCGFFLGCPAIEPDYIKIAEELREIDAAADAEAEEASESRLMGGGGALVKGNEPAVAAKKEKFCRDIQMLIVEAKSVRRRKIKRMQDQSCYICMRTVAAPEEKTADMCKAFDGKDDKIPEELEAQILLPPHIQVIMSGFDIQQQQDFRADVQKRLDKPESALDTKPGVPGKLRRRRLLESAQDAFLELGDAIDKHINSQGASSNSEVAALRSALDQAIEREKSAHKANAKASKHHRHRQQQQHYQQHGHHAGSTLKGQGGLRFRSTASTSARTGEGAPGSKGMIAKLIPYAMKPKPMGPPDMKAQKDCAMIDGAEQNMHCKYADIWMSEVTCNGQPVKPGQGIKKILDYKGKLHAPFHGNKKWCEAQQKGVAPAIQKLVRVLSDVVADGSSTGAAGGAGAAGAAGGAAGAAGGAGAATPLAAVALLDMFRGESPPGKKPKLKPAELVKAYDELHAKVFGLMSFGEVHVPVLRKRYSNRASAEVLRDGYGAPLASGPGSMCVEINMCTPDQLNGMWIRAQTGKAPVPQKPEKKAAAAR